MEGRCEGFRDGEAELIPSNSHAKQFGPSEGRGPTPVFVSEGVGVALG